MQYQRWQLGTRGACPAAHHRAEVMPWQHAHLQNTARPAHPTGCRAGVAIRTKQRAGTGEWRDKHLGSIPERPVTCRMLAKPITYHGRSSRRNLSSRRSPLTAQHHRCRSLSLQLFGNPWTLFTRGTDTRHSLSEKLLPTLQLKGNKSTIQAV